MSKEKNFASAVIYVHNAAEKIEGFLKMTARVLQENFEHCEIVCVNDKSTDDSVKIIRQAAQGLSGITVTVVNLSYFHGVESAMAAGNAMTIGDFVFEFDSCLQDFSEDIIMAVYRKALQGYDVVSAVPQKKNRFSSRLFYWLMERYSRVPIDLNTERFCVVSRRVINRVKDLNQKIPYRKMAYATSGLRTSSVAYPVLDTGSDGVLEKKERKYRERLAVDTLLLFTDVGYRMASGLSVLMMLIAVFMAVYSLVIYLSAVPVAGWTTTILFLSIAFVGLFALLAVIIKYLQILVELIFKRKQFTFESIEKVI